MSDLSSRHKDAELNFRSAATACQSMQPPPGINTGQSAGQVAVWWGTLLHCCGDGDGVQSRWRSLHSLGVLFAVYSEVSLWI